MSTFDSNIKPLTKEELAKIALTTKQRAHYSKADEIKTLLFERELYKRMYEEQQKRIDSFVAIYKNKQSPIYKIVYYKTKQSPIYEIVYYKI